MTWVRLDDQFADHPKVVGLSAPAFRLHVTAICYAARQETDGLIPSGAAFVIKRYAAELVAAGLWEHHLTGFRVHDYLDYNPSSESLRAKRATESERKRRGIRPDVNDPVPDPYPTRLPVPVPPPLARCYRAYENMAGSLTKTIIDLIDGWYEKRQDADEAAVWVETACQLAAEHEARTWAYVKSILARWEREGFQTDTRQKQSGPPDGNNATIDPDFVTPERIAELKAKGRYD